MKALFPLRRTFAASLVLLAAACPALAIDIPEPEAAQWRLEAATQQQEGDEITASGDVFLQYGDIILQADKVVFNRATNVVTAEGNVVLMQGTMKVTGDMMEMNLKEETGVIYEAVAFEQPTYFFKGDRIRMRDRERFILYKGLYTTCNQPQPYWGLRSSSCRARVEGYARFRNLRFIVRGVPVFYTPYWIWPIKQDRTSGMLIPEPGYSQQKGWYIRNQFYWAAARNMDATFTHDYFELFGQGFGLETRFLTGPTSKGKTDFYLFEEQETGRERYYAKAEYEAQPWNGRFRVLYEDADSLGYYRNFEYFLNSISTRRTRSNMYYSKNWKTYSGNFLLERELSYLTDTDAIELMRLPELSLRRRLTPLWPKSKLLFSYEAIGTSILKNTPIVSGGVKTDEINTSYERGVFRPTLSLPWNPGAWLGLNAQINGSVSYYTRSAHPDDARYTAADPLWHKYWGGQLQVLGPRFEKIFDERPQGFFARFKHLIEPQLTYSYQTEDKGASAKIPRFDTYDSSSSYSHIVSYSLVNYLYGKPRDKAFSTAEVFKLSLNQSYSLDSSRYLSTKSAPDGTLLDRSYFSPINLNLRYNPVSRFSLDASATYDYLYNDVARAQLSGEISSPGGNSLQITWSFGRALSTGVISTNQVRAAGTMVLLNERFHFDGEVSYDIDRSVVQHQRYGLRYANQCSAFMLEIVQKNLGVFDDLEYRFSIELKDVGTILRL